MYHPRMSDTVLYAPTDDTSKRTGHRPPAPPQTYENHTRRDIAFMFAMIVLLVNFGVVTVTAIRYDLNHFTWMTILWIAVAFATVVIGLKARTNPLKVQDRLIRLEERIRYTLVLSPALAERSESLEVKQMVALRFASDAELPALIERTLAENLTPKQIKQSIVTWRPDHLRV